MDINYNKKVFHFVVLGISIIVLSGLRLDAAILAAVLIFAYQNRKKNA